MMMRQWTVFTILLIASTLIGCSSAPAPEGDDSTSTTDGQPSDDKTDDSDESPAPDGALSGGGDFNPSNSGEGSPTDGGSQKTNLWNPPTDGEALKFTLEELAASTRNDLSSHWIELTGKVDIFRVGEVVPGEGPRLIVNLKPESDDSDSGAGGGFLAATCVFKDNTAWQKAAAGDVITVRGHLAPQPQRTLVRCTLVKTNGHGVSRLVIPELLATVAQNGQQAEEKYNGKTMIVTGKITRLIGATDGAADVFGSFTSTMYLSDESGSATLPVHHAPATPDPFAKAKVGDTVTLIGQAVVSKKGDKYQGGLSYAAPLSQVQD